MWGAIRKDVRRPSPDAIFDSLNRISKSGLHFAAWTALRSLDHFSQFGPPLAVNPLDGLPTLYALSVRFVPANRSPAGEISWFAAVLPQAQAES
jgi:hypothetical protein